MLQNCRRSLLPALVFFALLLPLTCAMAQNTTPGRANILFTQQDEVQEFILHNPDADHPAPWGTGFQTGTAVGKITGTSYVSWTFQVASPIVNDKATIAFVNTVIITDLDGDQVTFVHAGNGLFHFAFGPDTFQGTGGTLDGTYEVTGGIGKYASWVGRTYDYRGVATNPPPRFVGDPPHLGTVYAEIYSNPDKKK